MCQTGRWPRKKLQMWWHGWSPRERLILAGHIQSMRSSRQQIKETIMPELIQEPESPVQTPAVSPKKVSRRNMLLTLGIALNAVAGALFAVPVVGYILGPARRKEMKKELAWITLGPMTQFPEGETRLATYRNPFVRPWDGDTGNIPCWVRRISADKLQVFAINCAHLGCPVRWYAQSGLFLCPCHGGAYYADGRRAS